MIVATEVKSDTERLLKQTSEQESRDRMLYICSSTFRIHDQNSQRSAIYNIRPAEAAIS